MSSSTCTVLVEPLTKRPSCDEVQLQRLGVAGAARRHVSATPPWLARPSADNRDTAEAATSDKPTFPRHRTEVEIQSSPEEARLAAAWRQLQSDPTCPSLVVDMLRGSIRKVLGLAHMASDIVACVERPRPPFRRLRLLLQWSSSSHPARSVLQRHSRRVPPFADLCGLPGRAHGCLLPEELAKVDARWRQPSGPEWLRPHRRRSERRSLRPQGSRHQRRRLIRLAHRK